MTDLDALEDLLSRPTPDVVADLANLDGDIMVLGAGGKIGPSIARMAKRASPDKTVFVVARFSEPELARKLEADGLAVIRADLMDRSAIAALPAAKNVLFLAGHKFGSSGAPGLTWAMNTFVPGMVAERFRESRIVALFDRMRLSVRADRFRRSRRGHAARSAGRIRHVVHRA